MLLPIWKFYILKLSCFAKDLLFCINVPGVNLSLRAAFLVRTVSNIDISLATYGMLHFAQFSLCACDNNGSFRRSVKKCCFLRARPLEALTIHPERGLGQNAIAGVNESRVLCTVEGSR
jgi:hypothetical protein